MSYREVPTIQPFDPPINLMRRTKGILRAHLHSIEKVLWLMCMVAFPNIIIFLTIKLGSKILQFYNCDSNNIYFLMLFMACNCGLGLITALGLYANNSDNRGLYEPSHLHFTKNMSPAQRRWFMGTFITASPVSTLIFICYGIFKLIVAILNGLNNLFKYMVNWIREDYSEEKNEQ